MSSFSELDDLANTIISEQQEKDAIKAISKARATLVLTKTAKAVFFATIAMKMKVIVDRRVPTMATDGKHLYVGPAFTTSLPPEEVLGVVAHEVMHIALQHHSRMGSRNHSLWNVAADLAINSILVDCKYKIPKDGLFPGRGDFAEYPPGLSAEEYYHQLQKDKKNRDKYDGLDPGGCGGVLPPGDNSSAARAEAACEAKILASQAAEAAKQASRSGRGDLPGALDRLIGESMQSKVDWRAKLRDFLTKLGRSDYSWSDPNRRYVSMGLYLPGLRSYELGKVVVLVDHSGSIGDDQLKLFAGEIEAIVASYSAELSIVYHDTHVTGEETWSSGDGPLVLKCKDGGGTSHVAAFEHISQMEEPPEVVVCLTDMFTVFPIAAPGGVPVLWCSTTPLSRAPKPGFGEVLEILN